VTVDEGFYVGGSATLQAAFSDPLQPGTQGDLATDPNTGFKYVLPTAVTCVLRKPGGVEIPLTVVPPSPAQQAAGNYAYSAKTPTFDVAGLWSYGWTASGTYSDYKPGVIAVKAART
jgi:hypothetical protein